MDSEEGDSLEHWFGNCNSNPLEVKEGHRLERCWLVLTWDLPQLPYDVESGRSSLGAWHY